MPATSSNASASRACSGRCNRHLPGNSWKARGISRASIFGYSRACKPKATGIFYFGKETANFFPALGFVCGGYRDDIQPLKGQIMVPVFRKTDAGVAVVYEEWKGPAFDPSDPRPGR